MKPFLSLQTAVQLDIPVMSLDWLDFVWENRHRIDFNPAAPDVLARFRVKAFTGLKLALVNFSEKDKEEMVQLTQANGQYQSFFMFFIV